MEKKITDEELIFLYMQENVKAYKALYARYRAYSSFLARKFIALNYDSGVSIESLVLVGSLSFFKALKKFNLKKNKFYPYWRQIATNDILKYLEANSYQYEAKIFKGSYSLNELAYEEGVYEFNDSVGKKDEIIEFNIDKNELLTKLENDPQKRFNGQDLLIFELLLMGYDTNEISKKLKINERNLKYRLKKCRKILKEFN